MRYSFEHFTLDPDRRELRRNGAVVGIEPKVFDFLLHLIEQRDRVVSKDDLLREIWKGRIVSEAALTTCLNAARSAIGDTGEAQRLIKTFPRKGFRFVGDVRELSQDECDTAGPHSVPNIREIEISALDKPSIAVMPFSNLSAEPDQEYFADGITEDIITALSEYRWFFVADRNSSFSFKNRDAETRAVARELGIRYVLEGSVRRMGSRIRITAHLVDGDTGKQIWANRFDRELTDIFAIQDELTESVAGAIEPELLKAEGGRAVARRIENLTAWDLVRQGTWHFHQLSETGHLQARDLFREAVRLNPALAEAQIWLSRACTSIVAYGWHRNEADEMRESMDAALRAVQLDEKNAYAQYSLAMAYIFSNAMDPAIRFAGKAIELSPSFALGHLALGMARLYSGNAADGVAPLQRGLKLNPYDAQNFHWFRVLALAQYFSEDKPAALQSALRSLNIRPLWPFTLETVAVCHAGLGRLAEAQKALGNLDPAKGPKRDPILPLKILNPDWAKHISAMLQKAAGGNVSQ